MTIHRAVEFEAAGLIRYELDRIHFTRAYFIGCDIERRQSQIVNGFRILKGDLDHIALMYVQGGRSKRIVLSGHREIHRVLAGAGCGCRVRQSG